MSREQPEDERAEEDVLGDLDVDPGIHLAPVEGALPQLADGATAAGEEERAEELRGVGVGDRCGEQLREHRAGLPALFFAAAAVVGAGFGLCFLAGLRIVSQASGRDERSRAVSTFFLLGYLALSLPAIAAGLLRTRWGLDATFMAFGVTVMIGCAAAAWLVVRHHRRELAAVPTDPTAPEVTTDAGDRASGRR